MDTFETIAEIAEVFVTVLIIFAALVFSMIRPLLSNHKDVHKLSYWIKYFAFLIIGGLLLYFFVKVV